MRYTMGIIMKHMIPTASIATVGAAAALFAVYGMPSAPPVPVQESKVVELEVTPTAWTCPDCTENEQYVLAELQKHTKISDRNALAAIMGNIKQESNFVPNICEEEIEFLTTIAIAGVMVLFSGPPINRYNNLGKFCENYGCDPSSLEGQTRYMINESTFQKYLPEFEGRGFTVSQYMVPSYYWLGWHQR